MDSFQIDCLHEQLEEAMKSRLSMITRQVREVKNIEDEIRQMKRKLENFDRYASSGTLNTGCSGCFLALLGWQNFLKFNSVIIFRKWGYFKCNMWRLYAKW